MADYEDIKGYLLTGDPETDQIISSAQTGPTKASRLIDLDHINAARDIRLEAARRAAQAARPQGAVQEGPRGVGQHLLDSAQTLGSMIAGNVPGSPWAEMMNYIMARGRSMLPWRGTFREEMQKVKEAREEQYPGAYGIDPEARRDARSAAEDDWLTGTGPGMAAPLGLGAYAPIVYHMTKPGAAAAIIREGKMVPKEDGLFFSDRPFSEHTSGYGTAAVRMDVPAERLMLDDEFPSGEKHYRVEAETGKPTDVREWLERGADRRAPHPNLLRNWEAVPVSRNPDIGTEVVAPGGMRGTVVGSHPTPTGSSNQWVVRMEDGTTQSMPATFWRKATERATRRAQQSAEPPTLDAIREAARGKGVTLDLYEGPKSISLPRIVVPEGSRGTGIGTDLMRQVTEYADSAGKPIALSPSTDFGATSKQRLIAFYKRFGFVENKGRNRNLEISESMYRPPQGKER